MESAAQLAITYQNMSEGELLEIANESGLTSEARQVIAEELHRRKLRASDLPRVKEPRQTSLEQETEERWFPLTRGHSLGFGLYGRKYLNEADKEANIQVRTKFFVFAIPLVPIASYRFKCTGDANKWFHWDAEQQVLNRVPLDWSQVLRTWLTTALWIGGTIAAIVLYEYFRGR
jgi:hypothetical protein